MKVWNIIMNSTSLLNEQNIEYILLMKTKEDVINTYTSWIKTTDYNEIRFKTSYI